jgi:serine/threonine protein kinase
MLVSIELAAAVRLAADGTCSHCQTAAPATTTAAVWSSKSSAAVLQTLMLMRCPATHCAGAAAGEGSKPEDTNLVGTPHYMSPELLSCKDYGFKTDVW